MIYFTLTCLYPPKHVPILLCDMSSVVKGQHIKDGHRNDTVMGNKEIHIILMSLLDFLLTHHSLSEHIKLSLPEGHDNDQGEDGSLHEPLADAAWIWDWTLP